jgi:hypothetical protein
VGPSFRPMFGKQTVGRDLHFCLAEASPPELGHETAAIITRRRQTIAQRDKIRLASHPQDHRSDQAASVPCSVPSTRAGRFW